MDQNNNETKTYCGFVAIVGRPNVGKSTLINTLMGEKVSIATRKPQTTRDRILGVKTTDDRQIIYVDTPGIHLDAKKALNRSMNKTAKSTLYDVDCVMFVVESLKWTDEDQHVLKLLEKTEVPVMLLINKVDRVKDKERLLPYIQKMQAKREFCEIIPISAQKGDNLTAVEEKIASFLPESPFYYGVDQVTDRSERFRVAELIREQLTLALGEELPYVTAVEIEQFKREDKLVRIAALIWVEREGQKGIVVGKDGIRLKQLGQAARQEMQSLLKSKVYLQLWVKVKSQWSDNSSALKSLGYMDFE